MGTKHKVHHELRDVLLGAHGRHCERIFWKMFAPRHRPQVRRRALRS